MVRLLLTHSMRRHRFLLGVLLIVGVLAVSRTTMHNVHQSSMMASTMLIMSKRDATANIETVETTATSILKTVAVWQASGEPFGDCGGQNHTSISLTAREFVTDASYHIETGSGSSSAIKGSPFTQIALSFPAVDMQGQRRTSGGDEFVVTLTYFTDGVAYRQSMPAIDKSTGSYSAAFLVPQQGVDKLSLTLLHFYSCYQGLGAHKPKEPFFKLSFGPIHLNHTGLQNYLQQSRPLAALPNTNTNSSSTPPHQNQPSQEYFLFPQQPHCDLSQMGVDTYLQSGLWVEANDDNHIQNESITLNAKWKSVACQPQSSSPHQKGLPDMDVIRIGDSTMPSRKVRAGDPFYHYREYSKQFRHHKSWVSFLTESLNKTKIASSSSSTVIHDNTTNNNNHKVLLFSGGIHQLLQLDPYSRDNITLIRGYNVPTAVRLLTRMVCQMALVNPDRKMLWVGATPVQQHLYHIVDNTDHNILWLNAWLRQRIVEQHHGRLADICSENDIELATLWSIPDAHGNAHNGSTSKQLFEVLSHEPMSREEETLTDTLSQVQSQLRSSDKAGRVLYGDRMVVFADIHDILLARPECFIDKIHDTKTVIKGRRTLMHSQHRVLLDTLSRMRAMMVEP